MALVDTGASHSCISERVAQSSGLVPYGNIDVGGVTGVGTVRQYFFGVTLRHPLTEDMPSLNETHWIDGCGFVSPGMTCDLLLGRDLLCKGMLSFSCDGHFAFSV